MEHRSFGVPDLVSSMPSLVPFTGDTHEFDGDLLVIQKIGTFENNTKGSLSDFLSDAIVDTHYVR